MKVTLHGCRGSIATASPDTQKYGGNTTCFELSFKGYKIVFDTGTGFQNLAFAGKDITKLILYSHFHHDHIQGLAFHDGLFDQGHQVTFSTALVRGDHLRRTTNTYFSGQYFPMDMLSKTPHIQFKDISVTKSCFAHDFQLDWLALAHPGGSYGYSITHGHKKFCYLCDHEFHETQCDAITAFTQGADMVVWDGMFTDAELGRKAGWGHSSIEQGVRVFENADIANMMITHHAPTRTDAMLDDLQSLLPDGVQFARDQLSVWL